MQRALKRSIPEALIDVDQQSAISSISARSVDLEGQQYGSSPRKLDLLQNKLFGREEQTATIGEAWERLTSSAAAVAAAAGTTTNEHNNKSSSTNCKSEICLIHGSSGTGKTVLVEALRNKVFDAGGYFVLGKSDQVSNSTPYSALVSAFSDLCELIRLSDAREEIKRDVERELSRADIKVLGRFVSTLSYLIDYNDDVDDKAAPEQDLSSMAAFTKFKILCRTFLQVVSSSTRPTVLVCDDMQWADQASIDVISSFMNGEMNHVLLVCLYRDDEELISAGKHPLNRLISDFRSNTDSVTVTDIPLKGLDLDSINQVVSSVLKRPLQDTLSLAELLITRTQGNAYFCLRFLEMLEMQGLLFRDEDTQEFSWNVDTIREQTTACDNVVKVMSSSIENASPVVKVVLIYAAFLGFQFSCQVVELILEREIQEADKGTVLDDYWTQALASLGAAPRASITKKALAKAVDIGFVEKIVGKDDASTSYKFTHDRVQDCLLQCINVDQERESLHLRIGRSIRSLMTEGKGDTVQDWMYFRSASNMNKAARLLDDDGKRDLVLLNLAAGRLAASKSAFNGATDFLRQALHLLDDESWNSDHDVCLLVHDTAAEYEHCTGNFDESVELAVTVLAKAKSLDERLRAMRTRVSALLGAGRLHDTIDVALAAIAELGVVRCPKKRTSMAAALLEFGRCHRKMTKWTDEDYLTMPIMDNPYLIVASTITIDMGLASYMLGGELRPLNVHLSLVWCAIFADAGLSAAGPMQLAAYGFALASLGKFSESRRIAMITQQLMDRCNSLNLVGFEQNHIAMTYSLVAHWTWLTLSELREKFERGFKLGMEVADTAYAFNNLNDCAMLEFHLATKSFSRVRDICHEFSKRADEYQLSNVAPLAHALCDTVDYFLGCNCGDATTDKIGFGGLYSKNELVIALHHFYRLIVAYHFDNEEVLKDALAKVRANMEVTKCHFIGPFFWFYTGMAHYLLYSWKGNRRNRRAALRITSLFQSYERKGLINRTPLLKVLLLEKAALRGSNMSVQSALVDAVRTCETHNFVFTKALAKERAAAAMLHRDQENVAKRLAILSLEVYDSKGMFGKVQYLDQKFDLDDETYQHEN